MRGLFMALFLLFGAHAVSTMMTPTNFCTEQCDDDDANGQCPPSCVDCSCCLHTTPMVSAPVQLAAPHGVELTPVFLEPSPLHSADPRAILHVPKLRSA
jgi:hypothetical protein